MGRATYSWQLLVAIGFISTIALAQNNADLEEVATGNAAFGVALFDLLRNSTKDNLLVSPIGVATIMAMLQAGARGNTADAIRKTMKFPEDLQLNNGFKAILQQMKSNRYLSLEKANGIYPANNFNLNPEFINTLKSFYESDPQQLNYNDPQKAASTINEFVSGSTDKRIQDVIGPSDLDDLTRLVLVNAIYLNGELSGSFYDVLSILQKFYVSQNETQNVEWMVQNNRHNYDENKYLDAKIVSIPYLDSPLSLVIILPNKIDGLAEMENKLMTLQSLDFLRDLQLQNLNIWLPKFKLESTIDLKQSLTALGAGEIFSDSADLSGMSENGKEQIHVSKAVQKVIIDVNNPDLNNLIIPNPILVPRQQFVVNHPFYFAVVITIDGSTTQTFAPLFMGKIYRPKTR